MTMGEKLSLVQGDTVLEGNGTGVNACVGHLPAIKRLGLPNCVSATVRGRRQWNDQGHRISGADRRCLDMGREAHEGIRHRIGRGACGKGRNVVLAPTLNILRTPRWGAPPSRWARILYSRRIWAWH